MAIHLKFFETILEIVLEVLLVLQKFIYRLDCIVVIPTIICIKNEIGNISTITNKNRTILIQLVGKTMCQNIEHIINTANDTGIANPISPR